MIRINSISYFKSFLIFFEFFPFFIPLSFYFFNFFFIPYSVLGLLAGYSFTTISSQKSTRSNLEFIIEYQPNAMEYRRLFYLFCSISLVGSIDTLLTLVSKAVHKQGKIENVEDNEISGIFGPLCKALSVQGDSTVFLAIIIAILHGICFLSTIIMSKVDILIAIRGGESISIPSITWATQLLSSHDFQNELTDWQTLDQVRVVCALLAWAGVCYLSYKGVTAVDSKNTEIYRYFQTTVFYHIFIGF